MKSIRTLEKVAVEFSKTTIRYYNILIPPVPYPEVGPPDTDNYTGMRLPEISPLIEEKIKLISKASDTLGDYDFFFEWGRGADETGSTGTYSEDR